MIFRLRRRHRELAARVTDARARAEQARRDLEDTRASVVEPLAAWRDRNHFADLIRASLLEGRGAR